MKKFTLLFAFIAISLGGIVKHAYAQNPQWINYTNGNNIHAIATEGNDIWVGTEGGLVKINSHGRNNIL